MTKRLFVLVALLACVLGAFLTSSKADQTRRDHTAQIAPLAVPSAEEHPAVPSVTVGPVVQVNASRIHTAPRVTIGKARTCYSYPMYRSGSEKVTICE